MKKISSLHISLLLLLLLPAISSAAAQPPSPENSGEDYYQNYASFSSTLAIIMVVFVTAMFFMGFFSIYIRYCSHSSAAAALPLRNRRSAAARGLDASVLETFPILPYSEVKDHQIGKGAPLECAVCLNEFEESETLRLIPKCDHVFHPECIDAWLQSHVTCPVCRTNLAPQAEDEQSHVPEPVEGSEINEIVIEVGDNEPESAMNRSSSPKYPRAGSIRRPKFRSHSTGHSLVQPGQNLERYTLRLPEGVREEVMKRTGSLAAREGSLRGGAGRRTETGAKSDGCVFFSKGKLPKVADEGGECSGSTPVKLPSLRCLEPKTMDEAGLISCKHPN